MQLARIKQYSFRDLSHIALYKAALKVVHTWENLLLCTFGKKLSKVKSAHTDEQKYSEIPTLFSCFYELCSSDDKSIVSQALMVMEGRITIFGNNVDFNPETDWLKDPITGSFWDRQPYFEKAPFTQNGCSDVKNVLEVNKMNQIVHLAQAYYITRDDKYIKGIERQLRGWIKCVPLERSVVNRIVMDMAFRSINLIQVSLLCYKSKYFIENIHPLILSVLLHYEFLIRRFSTPRWFKTGTGANHSTGELAGLLVIQLWLQYFTGKNYGEHFHTEFNYLQEVLDRTIAPSGAYLEESANYSRLVAEFLIMLDISFVALQPRNPLYLAYSSKHHLSRLLNYVYDLSYHNQLPNFGDNDNARVLLPFMANEDSIDYLFKYKKYLKDSIAMRSYDKYIDGSQWIYQSGDKNDVYVFTRVGTFCYFKEGASSHAHNDILSVLLYAKGIPVFIDKGRSYYNLGEKIRIECVGVAAHNSISFDNKEMCDLVPSGYINYPVSSCLSHEESDDSCSFIGKITYKGIEQVRKIDYRGSVLTITDEFKTGSSVTTGCISFLVGESIFVDVLGHNQLKLADVDNHVQFDMLIEGIDSVQVWEETYYPHFAEERKTHRINGYFNAGIQEPVNKIITKLSII